jgi:monovalent cation:H+ antiporter-2, CPA2 family
MHETALIEDLAIILCVAGIVTVLFQQIKQPLILGYLIAGLIIGPYTPPFSLIDDQEDIRILAELGVIFLMFSLGLEFSLAKLTKVGFSAFIIGVFEVVLMILVGYSVGHYLLGWPFYESLLLGAALSISSTTIIIKALEDLNLKKHFFAELMVGVLLIEDFLAILLMVFVSTTISSKENIPSHEVFLETIKLLLVVTSWFLGGYFAIPYLMRKIQNFMNYETLTTISTGLCLFLSAIALYFNYSAALGAFIMGAILAEAPQAQRIEALTLPIRDIFAAVFFVSVGMLIDPKMIITHLPQVLLLTIVTIVGKILISGIGSLISGQNLTTSVRIGFSMGQIGEFSFIIIGLGTIQKTTESLYPIIVAIATITTFATPYFIKLSGKISEQVEQKLPASLRHGLNAYIAAVRRFQEKAKQQILNHKGAIRFCINSMVVAILCTLALNFFIPVFLPANNQLSFIKFLIWAVTLLIASPFIWAMLFGSRPTHLISRILVWSLTVAELFFFLWTYFESFVPIIILAILMIIYFKLNYKMTKNLYYSFENQLISNLSQQNETEEQSVQRLSLYDQNLVRLKVLSSSPFIGQSLEESRLKTSFGIHIIAIKRDRKTIWLPRVKERILSNDEFIALGNEKDINQLMELGQWIEG